MIEANSLYVRIEGKRFDIMKDLMRICQVLKDNGFKKDDILDAVNAAYMTQEEMDEELKKREEELAILAKECSDFSDLTDQIAEKLKEKDEAVAEAFKKLFGDVIDKEVKDED